MKFITLSFLTLTLVVTIGSTGCRKEGTAEKAGRKVDDAVNTAKEKTEGALEKLGREVDEAVKETKEAGKAIEDAGK